MTSYYYCRNCRCIFQRDTPKSEDLKKYINNEYENGVYKQYVDASKMKYEHFNYRIREIKPFSSNGKLLDIGCSCGFFVEIALQNGYDGYGIEFSEIAISYAKPEIKKRIIHGDINTLKQIESQGIIGEALFDIVTAFDIIEHTENSIDFLVKIRTIIKTDGLLVLTTPDIDHFLRYFMKSRWPVIQPMQHIVLFSKKAIKIALEKAGYSDIQITVARKVISYEYLLKQIEIHNPFLFKMGSGIKYLLPKKLRYKLFYINIGEFMVIARKKGDY
jgi:2-polyprenyl-3-methyl-5-hydroxy-6-metoxy-1,4-benzoquinol methylase